MALIFDQNFSTRTAVVGHEEGGELVLDHRQDVEPVLEWNKALRNQHDGRFKDNWNLALTIPTVVYEDLMRRGIANDPDAFKAWIRSEEADPWRVHPSRNL